MTIKQKFDSIDQSKLTADQKAFLEKIKNVTKDFTETEMNKKVEQPLDNFIAKAKEKMPEAIKSAPSKQADGKPAKAKKPKRTAMSLAKEIRKEGESWSDARARASKMMKEDSKDLSKVVESELDKLTKLVKSEKDRSKLAGISGTDIKRDASRKAKPRGVRKVTHSGETSNQYGTFNNHLGRKYTENRDRHSDRLAPRYPKNAPLLENGGLMDIDNGAGYMNNVYEDGGNIDAFALRMVKSNGVQPAEVLKEDADVRYNRGGSVTNERKHVNHDQDYEVRYARPRPNRKGYKGVRNFAVGGGVFADTFTGETGTHYTGLVGETNAMSSGEMFENGGGIANQQLIADAHLRPAEIFGREGIPAYKNGGGIPNNYEGKTPEEVWNMLTTSQRYHFLHDHNKEIESTPRSIEDNTKKSYKFLPSKVKTSFTKHIQTGEYADGGDFMNNVYAKGGGVRQVGNREYSYGRNWTNDHKHINKGEEHEVTYNRKGKFLGIFNDGGMMNDKEFSLAEAIAFIKDAKKDRMTFYYNVYGGNDYFTLQPTFATPTGKLKGYPSKVTITKEGSITGKNLTYNDGGAITNERKHVNHEEDYEVRYAKPRPSRKGYKGARKFMAGGSMETPRIYVADLEAYNNGRLVGEWLDLSDYNDADELMDAIQDVLKKSGGEEYAIHDVEYVPRSMYSEYMGKRDFEELYEMMDLAKTNDLPLEVVQEVVSQYGESAVDEFFGKYDNAEDFAYEQVEEFGLENFSSPEYYVYITDTDRRLLAGEMADSYVNDIRDEDGGNRIIQEAGMDVSKYEDADSNTQEEMLDEAVEIVRDEYYDTWYEGLSDAYYFLVDEQGIYSPEDFFKASFVSVDYEKLARDLEQDYVFIEHDGYLYVFNVR